MDTCGGTMKRAALLAFVLMTAAASAQTQDLSPEELTRRVIVQRAFEAVVWEEPKAHPEPGLDLLHGVLEHEGCWPDGPRDSAGPGRVVCREHRHSLAGSLEDVGPEG